MQLLNIADYGLHDCTGACYKPRRSFYASFKLFLLLLLLDNLHFKLINININKIKCINEQRVITRSGNLPAAH